MAKDVDKRSVSPDDKVSGKELSIPKFVEARAAEMYYFEEILKNKHKESTRTPMQTVPKHMRRRAMSHNRFRVPSRIRALNSKYLRDNEKHILRCRKHARNSKLILLHYFKRSLRPNKATEDEPTNFMANKWLETHLWHARRMSMTIYCGYKIAVKSRQKQIRTTAAFSKHNSLIYDKSYYCMVRVKGQHCHMLLDKIGSVGRGKLKDCIEINLGDAVGEILCLKSCLQSFVLIALTPLQPHIETLVKKAAADEKLLIEISDLNDLVNVFELIGPRSIEVIYKTLRQIPSTVPSNFLSLLEKAGPAPPLYLPPLASVAVDCIYARNRDVSMPDDRRSMISTSNIDIGEFVKGLDSCDLGGVQRFVEGLNEDGIEGYLGRFVEARRGQYSHKRKKKPIDGIVVGDKEMKVEEIKPEEKEKEKMDIELEEEDEQRVRGLLHKIKDEEFKEFKVLIINTSIRSCDMNRVLVLVPSGYGKRLWRKFCLTGAKAMGKIEYDHTYHQFSLPVFPQDNPESILFEDFEINKKAKDSTIYFRKPPAKRPNYLKLKSPFPFTCNFSSLAPIKSSFLQTFSKVTITSLFTGVPDTNAFICYPQESDMISLLQEYKTSSRLEDRILNSEPALMSIESSIKDEMFKYPAKDALVRMLDDTEISDCSRPTIGRLTSGYLHFGKARGFGFGAMLTSELDKLKAISEHLITLKGTAYLKLPKNAIVAVFRNPSSAYYHFCTVNIVR